MPIIRYTKTYFNEPGRIAEDAYLQLKRKLSADPDFEIDPNPETFSEHFKGSLNFLKWGLGYCLVFGLIYGAFFEHTDHEDSAFRIILTIPAIIGGLGSFLIFISLLLEGPSFATYIKEKKQYFSRMKYAIKNSSDYRTFYNSFYK